ncbi:hypothetical protein TNCV_1099651 [Trichonephila clavipes]|nr:hypothetical protein TNCV_1099651 [Trichonephila clavipes]
MVRIFELVRASDKTSSEVARAMTGTKADNNGHTSAIPNQRWDASNRLLMMREGVHKETQVSTVIGEDEINIVIGKSGDRTMGAQVDEEVQTRTLG